MWQHGTLLLVCSWVLWSHGFAVGSEVWVPFDSYERLEECKREWDAAMKRAESRGATSPKISYVCLPDTINPMTRSSNNSAR